MPHYSGGCVVQVGDLAKGKDSDGVEFVGAVVEVFPGATACDVVLAQGGVIRHYKDEDGRISDIECLTREGWLLTLCTLDLFKTLRQKGLIASSKGGPYRITRLGLQVVRSRPDNR